MTFITRLTVSLSVTTIFSSRHLNVFRTRTSRHVTKALTKATTAGTRFLRVGRTRLLFIMRAIRRNFIIRTRRFVDNRNTTRHHSILPTNNPLFLIFRTINQRLLRRRTANTATVNVRPRTNTSLLKRSRMVNRTFQRNHTVRISSTLVTLTLNQISNRYRSTIKRRIYRNHIENSLINFVAHRTASFPLTQTLSRRRQRQTFKAHLGSRRAVRLRNTSRRHHHHRRLTGRLHRQLQVKIFDRSFNVTTLRHGRFTANVTIVGSRTLNMINVQ